MAAQQEKVRGVVDIVFLIDATGSMSECISALKENVSQFINYLTTKDANNSSPVRDWRAKVVGYRDFQLDANPWVDKSFVRDVDQLKTQLADLKAEGGGDEPESLLDGLYRLSNMGQTNKGENENPAKWRSLGSASRIVVVFTDASYKPTMHIPEAKGGTVNDVVNAMMSNRIILSLFAPNKPGYDELSAIDKCEWTETPDLKALSMDSGSFQKTLIALAKSVSCSAATPEI